MTDEPRFTVMCESCGVHYHPTDTMSAKAFGKDTVCNKCVSAFLDTGGWAGESTADRQEPNVPVDDLPDEGGINVEGWRQ